jgi:predicted transcriptional regulator
VNLLRATKLVTISVPPELYKKAKTVAQEEGRTQAELFREALRFYLALRPFPVPHLEKPRKIPKDQAWFWSKEWQKGEQEANEAILKGRLYGPFATPEEIRKAARRR